MKTPELLPCPFCGSDDLLLYGFASGEPDEWERLREIRSGLFRGSHATKAAWDARGFRIPSTAASVEEAEAEWRANKTCSLCQITFTTTKALRWHMKTKHGIKS